MPPFLQGPHRAHVVSQAQVVATGVSIDATREVFGTTVGDSESFEFWREFLTSLRARGLSGVRSSPPMPTPGSKPLSSSSSPDRPMEALQVGRKSHSVLGSRLQQGGT